MTYHTGAQKDFCPTFHNNSNKIDMSFQRTIMTGAQMMNRMRALFISTDYWTVIIKSGDSNELEMAMETSLVSDWVDGNVYLAGFSIQIGNTDYKHGLLKVCSFHN
jgi:hypothetical protein